ncbi:MAG TPA: PQQ-binding-like beta-propeller repeat protein, partial [Acidimicrobiales bacterium]|nr:PQQ-binding-like beta-propeller repeat protein [Acidimicrobiales bacterium]
AEVWSTELGPAGVGGYDSEPIVADGHVYVGHSISDVDGGVSVHALDGATGAPVWERQVVAGNTNIGWSLPLARSGDVLTAGYVGILGAGGCTAAHAELDPSDGSGPITTDGIQISSAVTAGAMVVRLHKTIDDPASIACAAGPATVRARNLDTGREVWALSFGPSLSAGSAWHSTFVPTVADGRAFVAWGTRLVAFALGGCGAPTCQPTWTATAGAEISGTTPPVATNGGQVLVVTQDGELLSFSAANGALRWRADLDWEPSGGILDFGPRPAIAVRGDVAYVTSSTGGEGHLRAYAANGCGTAVCAPLWSATVPATVGAPATTGGVVFVGTDGSLLAYDAAGCGAATCDPVATVPVTGTAYSLAIADGRLYTSGNGHVTALAPTPPPTG